MAHQQLPDSLRPQANPSVPMPAARRTDGPRPGPRAASGLPLPGGGADAGGARPAGRAGAAGWTPAPAARLPDTPAARPPSAAQPRGGADAGIGDAGGPVSPVRGAGVMRSSEPPRLPAARRTDGPRPGPRAASGLPLPGGGAEAGIGNAGGPVSPVRGAGVMRSSEPPRDRAGDGDTGSSAVASGKAAPGDGPADGGRAGRPAVADGSGPDGERGRQAATARGSGADDGAGRQAAGRSGSGADGGAGVARRGADGRRGRTAGGGAVAAPAREAGEALTGYLQDRATAFMRGLSLRGENESEADTLLRASARRIAGVLHTYAPLTDPAWAEPLRAELGWLSATLGREPQYTGRLARLLEALRRLSAAGMPEPAALTDGVFGTAALPEAPAAGHGGGPLALGAARAAALLERQLTLARTRAHSATLQAMGSSRFHGLADAIAVLASDVPLAPAAAEPAAKVLPPLAAQAHQRLADAVAALPLHRAGHPYNAEAVEASLGVELTADLQDAPWHHVRILLRLSRYAAEVPEAGPAGDEPLEESAALLQRHREAAESAAAAASAARTPRIAPATAYALGVLHADQRHEVEATRFAFSRLWQPHTVLGAGRD